MAASKTLTPQQRALRASIAANARWARDGDRKANGERGQAGLQGRFEREVDPDGILPEKERKRRAENARREYMKRLAYKSSRARSASQRDRVEPAKVRRSKAKAGA